MFQYKSNQEKLMKRMAFCFALIALIAVAVGCDKKKSNSTNGSNSGFLAALEANGITAFIQGAAHEANHTQSNWVIVAKTQVVGGTPVRIPIGDTVQLFVNGTPKLIPSYHLEVEDQFGGTTIQGGQFMVYSSHNGPNFRQFIRLTIYNDDVVADTQYVEVVAEGSMPIGTLALFNARTMQRSHNLQTLNADDDDNLFIQGVVVLRQRGASDFTGISATVTGAQGLTTAGANTNGADATRVQTPGIGQTFVTLQRNWPDTGTATAQVSVNVTNDTTPPTGTVASVVAVYNAGSGSCSVQIQMPAGYTNGADFAFRLEGRNGVPFEDVNRTVVNGYAIYVFGDSGPGRTYTVTPASDNVIGTTGNAVDTAPIVVVSQ